VTSFDLSALASGFIIFCRIGTCLAFAPGFSTPRAPMRARLLTALALSLALAPGILEDGGPNLMATSDATTIALIVKESLVGAAIGIMARIFFALFEMMLTAASMSIGASSSFSPRIDEAEAAPEFAALVMFSATSLLFVTNMHWQIVRAVHDSYAAIPIGAGIEMRFALAKMVDALSVGSAIAFRLACPFIFFGLVCNFGFALANKLIPQVAIYFVAAPVVLFCGLSLLSKLWTDMAMHFLAAFEDWLYRI